MTASLLNVARRTIAEHLALTTGVDTRTLDASRLQWIIDTRCRALGLPDAIAYAERLAASSEETEALIDAAVVAETRFFRDAAVFEHLRRWVPQMVATFPGELRVLSAPCSTGQEAYSVAATLHEAGVRPENFSITAVDLSTAALKVARKGIYPEEAMRSLAVEQQNACGSWNGKHWTMHAALRHRIHFKHLNLAEPNALGDERYHLILCRNLFIYLRPEARRALAQSLAAAMLPGGRLILGTADHVEELNVFFSPLKPAASFAFALRAHQAAEENPAVSTRTAASLILHKPHRVHTKPAQPHTPAKAKEHTATSLYDNAVHHQQQGDLRRAEHRCRQALYLDPQHLPALELLETLWLNLPDQRLRRALAARIHRTRSTARKPTSVEGAT